MENQNVKVKKRGRPRVLTDEERKNRKTEYMLNKYGFVMYVIQVVITLLSVSAAILTQRSML